MPTIVRHRGFEVYVIPGGHYPPHVHVRLGRANIAVGLRPVRILKVLGRVRDADLRIARRLVAAHEELCLQAFYEAQP